MSTTVMRPWSKGEAVCKLFEGIPELVVKIFEYSNGKASAFVWFGMLRKGIYRAIWGNIELVRLMLQTNSQYSETIGIAGYHQLLDGRFHILAKRKQPIPAHMEVEFVDYAKRFLHMQAMPVCGICGTARNLKVYWHLGKRVCVFCCQQNFISEQRLRCEYGVSLSTRFYGKQFASLIAYHVTIAKVHNYDPTTFLQFSDNAKEIAAFLLLPKHLTTVMLWRPHLAKLLDLEGLKLWQSEKLRVARDVLAGHTKTMLVRRTMWNLKNGNFGFKPKESSRPIFGKRTDRDFAVMLKVGMLKVEFLKDETERRKKRSKIEICSRDRISELVERMVVAPMTQKPYNP